MRAFRPVAHAALGQMTETDADALDGLLVQVEATAHATPDLPDVYLSRLATCREAVFWAKTTRELTDYLNATSCLKVLLYDLEGFGDVTFEDPQPASGAQLPPVTERRKSDFVTTTLPWIVAGAGAVATGLIIYAATRST